MFKKFDKNWFYILYNEFKEPYFKNLLKIVNLNYKTKIICPKKNFILNIFRYINFNRIKIIFIGQDPYCDIKHATGIAFATNTILLPSSLQNIYKELYTDLGIKKTEQNNLLGWVDQGILLLNSVLTVEHKKPGSVNIGWETFTDKIIKSLSNKKKNLIFIFLGKYSLNKFSLLDLSKHIILSTSHPSSKSVNYGFFGSRIFSKINIHLKLMGNKKQINWNK